MKPNNIKKLRESFGLSQRGLAEISGITSTAISLLENISSRRPSTKTCEKIAAALGIEIKEVLGGSKITRAINLDGLTKEDRKIIVSLVERLKKK